MNKILVFPTWLSVLSLAVALFVPLGVGMIADTSVDIGNLSNIVQSDQGRFVPPDHWFPAPVEPALYRAEQLHAGEAAESVYLDHRV